jgi:GT2 family glycosyltransferase
MPNVDIIVVSYRDDRKLARCLACVRANCSDYNLILVDNNLNNRGFSRGCNYGADLGTAPLILFLNSDAYIQPGCLDALIKRAGGSQVGMVGAQQRDPDKHDVITFGGAVGSPYPYGRHAGGRVSLGNCDIAERQVWLNGACLLIKRGLWTHLKGFNPSLFMFYSDSDLSLRAKMASAELWYEPDAVCWHKLNSSRSDDKHLIADKTTFAEIWDVHNSNSMFNKNLSLYPYVGRQYG